MTPAQIKLAIYGGAALLALWLTRKRDPKASVELGVGTLDGVYGADIYYSARPSTLPPPDTNPLVPLIDRSAQAVRDYDADPSNPQPWEPTIFPQPIIIQGVE